MIPRLTHSRISPLPSEVTVCNSAKVNVPTFDAMANSRSSRQNTVLCSIRQVPSSGRVPAVGQAIGLRSAGFLLAGHSDAAEPKLGAATGQLIDEHKYAAPAE